MATIYYHIDPFNNEAAAQGQLCLMLSKNFLATGQTSITNQPVVGVSPEPFRGAGICKTTRSGGFTFTVNGVVYSFNENGKPISLNAMDYELRLGVVRNLLSEVGSEVPVSDMVEVTRTRGAAGIEYSDPEIVESGSLMVSNLNARDQFAIQALRGMLERIDNPESISSSAMNQYCQSAYMWAANMMSAAAAARVKIVDDVEESTSPPAEEIGILETNTEKLLNNILSALERTDYKETVNNKQEFSERIYNPKMMDWLNMFSKHTPVNPQDTKKNVNLEDLLTVITALKDNVTTAMTNMQTVMTQQLGAYNQMVTQLALIASNLQGFTQSMDTDMTNINDNVSAARSDVGTVNTTVNGINTTVNTINSTANTIKSNLDVVKSDVAIIKQNTTP